MKTLYVIAAFSFTSFCCMAQNVGVGTATPTEKLDVNGNINVSGQVKVNGNAGTSNQVLMKDAGNNLVWGYLDYKNIQVFDCGATAFTTGASNCTDSWLVPAGVTSIFVECWGGGGGGANLTGGGGGGYISAKFTVTPGSLATITMGAGGNYGNVSTYGINGGSSTFFIGLIGITATGGTGGSNGDPMTSAANGQATGGSFSVSGLANQYLGFNGRPGGISKISFMTAGAADYAKVVNYGDGGDAGNLPGSGSKGGYKVTSAAINQGIYATQSGILCGGGGGADGSGGFYGRGGRVIVHW